MPDDLSPRQLHAVATKLRERYRPPSPTMTAPTYIAHEAMRALADALDEVARDQEAGA